MALTVMTSSLVIDSVPPGPITVSVTGYRPGLEYWMIGRAVVSLAGVPPGNDHIYRCTEPLERSSNLMLSPAQMAGFELVNSGVGASGLQER